MTWGVFEIQGLADTQQNETKSGLRIDQATTVIRRGGREAHVITRVFSLLARSSRREASSHMSCARQQGEPDPSRTTKGESSGIRPEASKNEAQGRREVIRLYRIRFKLNETSGRRTERTGMKSTSRSSGPVMV